jgi:hypothetical protein
MREASFDPTESVRSRLRVVVAAIGHELTCLDREASAAEHRASMVALTSLWARLTELMALEPVPELRLCPACGNSGMRAAIRCGFCWAALAPLSTSGGEPLQ